MSLFLTTLLTGIFLLILGLLFSTLPFPFRESLLKLPRSMKAAWLFLAIGGGWFLYEVSQLGEADFGNYRAYLIGGFALIGLLSCFVVKDFLSIRALAICGLMVAKALLDSAFMEPQASRLLLVVFAYLLVVASLYLGASPFRARDLLQWMEKQPLRYRLLGIGSGIWGLALVGAALTY